MEKMEGNESSVRLEQLIEEKSRLDPDSFPVLMEICAKEIEQIQSGQEFNKFIEIHDQSPSRVSFRIRLPIKEYPQANFVGRIVGQGGVTIKGLEEQTGCRIAVFGRGSIKDKSKEEELRLQGGKYAHLNHDLHVNLSAYGPPVSCYQRIANAMALIAPLLSPDYVDGASGGYQNGSGFMGHPRGRGMPPGMRRPMRGGPLMGSRGGATGSGRGGQSTMGSSRGGRGAVPLAFAVARAAAQQRGQQATRGASASRMGATSLGRGGMSRGSRGAGGSGGRWASAAADSNTSYQSDSYDYEPAPSAYESDSYGQSSYSAAAETDTYSYDYGHGEDAEQYEDYGTPSWTDESMEQPNSYGKSSAARMALGSYRSRPY